MATRRAGKDTARVIREQATDLFFDKGFAATTLREVAAASGVKVGSLYNHIASKEDLLQQILAGIIDDLVELQQQALATEGDSVEVLRAVVDCHIRFHAERAKAAYIGNTSLRSLPEAAREEIVTKRNDYERIIQSLIEQVAADGLGSVVDARLHTFSIVSQGTQVATWYHPEGRLTLDEVVAAHTKFALRELKVSDADERVDAAARKQHITV